MIEYSSKKENGMPFGLQPVHLLVIVIVALVIFGPKRLPQIGRWIGRTFAELRRGAREMADEFHQEASRPAQAGGPAPAAAGPAPAASASAATSSVPSNACAACGAVMDSEARYCSRCGQPLRR